MRHGFTRWLGTAAMAAACGAGWAGEGDPVDFGAPVSPAALDEHRGGESHFELNLQETQATMFNTVAIDTHNGSNAIDGGAFAGATGFPLAVQNTGNNVIVQNAFIINLDVR